MEHFVLWYGPWIVLAFAVLLRLLRTWLLRKPESDKPALKIYREEEPVYDPPLPPGFDPGYGYKDATTEQKEIQAAMAWEVHRANKEGRSSNIQVHTSGHITIGDELLDHDHITRQKALDRAEAIRNKTAAERVEPIHTKTEVPRRQKASYNTPAVIVAEVERLLGNDRVLELKAELGDDGYLAFLNSVVSDVQEKYQNKVYAMRDALFGVGGTLQDKKDLMRGLGFTGFTKDQEN